MDKLSDQISREFQEAYMSTKLVYDQLYDVNVARRGRSDWILELNRQILAMRKLLSFMLDPCVENILKFLDAAPKIDEGKTQSAEKCLQEASIHA